MGNCSPLETRWFTCNGGGGASSGAGGRVGHVPAAPASGSRHRACPRTPWRRSGGEAPPRRQWSTCKCEQDVAQPGGVQAQRADGLKDLLGIGQVTVSTSTRPSWDCMVDARGPKSPGNRRRPDPIRRAVRRVPGSWSRRDRAGGRGGAGAGRVGWRQVAWRNLARYRPAHRLYVRNPRN